MDIAAIMKTLGEPTRLKMFMHLLERKHCTRSMSKKLDISEPAVSQHLKIMREAGLIYAQKYGRHVHYLPSQEAIDFLAGTFAEMSRKSAALDRDTLTCQCEFRKEEEQ